MLFHGQPVGRGDEQLLPWCVCVSQGAKLLPLPLPTPGNTHKSNSTLYCGQMPRWGRMAAMLVCTSWPRMEAEPPLGGKRPLKMDLWAQGFQRGAALHE